MFALTSSQDDDQLALYYDLWSRTQYVTKYVTVASNTWHICIFMCIPDNQFR